MRPRPKVYITHQIPQKGIDTLLKVCNVAMWDSVQAVPRGELLNMVKGMNAIWCTPEDKIDLQVLDSAGPTLKVVGTVSEETGHINTQECENRGVKVVTLPKISMETVVNLTVAILLQASNQWPKDNTSEVPEVADANHNHVMFHGKTLGIVGLGKVGHAVAKRLIDLGVSQILYNDISEIPTAEEVGAKYVSFEKLLENSDIVCLSCKLNERSGNLFHKDAFKRMKNSAILIDCARGHVINYFDLYEALRKEEIMAAGLDVREQGHIPFKAPLQGLNNCHFFPYQEANHTWDHRSRYSATLAGDMLIALTESQ